MLVRVTRQERIGHERFWPSAMPVNVSDDVARQMIAVGSAVDASDGRLNNLAPAVLNNLAPETLHAIPRAGWLLLKLPEAEA